MEGFIRQLVERGDCKRFGRSLSDDCFGLLGDWCQGIIAEIWGSSVRPTEGICRGLLPFSWVLRCESLARCRRRAREQLGSFETPYLKSYMHGNSLVVDNAINGPCARSTKGFAKELAAVQLILRNAAH